jgi:CheY-like chemotaxis protein
MERMFAPALTESVRLVLDCEPNLQRISIDPRLLEQVIVNLLLNARDAMPEGGELRIETRNVDLDQAWIERHGGSRSGPHVRLTVQDSGCGMDPETVERIFEPFFTTKELGRGTGLGLATVYGIVKQAGGHIVVESKPGRGTTFAIYYPAVSLAVETPPRERRPGESVRAGSESVLLCEDDDVVRDLTARVLRSAGYQVLCAAGGSEALRLVEQHEGAIDLLITDVIMADIDGKRLAEQLSEFRPGLRVLYTSGYPSGVIAERGILHEGIQFLPKPYTRAELLKRVREVLEAAPLAPGPVE